MQTRDRYEQECLKIKGYLAQGHMVMGQEERKNKAKLEKTQISLATSNTEYEAAVKALEETTARWNREWKAAADKFQDLEEERLDFTKSSLWTLANVASTVCVSDDSSCEKIRLSLEKMEVEKDVINFIKEKGTGQEIPDPPKYINFCRGDMDSQSEVSDDDNYSWAQFPRSINPAFRSSSPQPSTFESHHDPNSALARDLGHGDPAPQSREVTVTPQKAPAAPQQDTVRSKRDAPRGYQPPRASNLEYDPNEFAPVPHDPYPMDGMTMLCRPTASDLSSAPSSSSARPSSRDSHSETSFSSQEPPAPLAAVKQERLQERQQERLQERQQERQPERLQERQPERLQERQPERQPERQEQPPASPDKRVLKKKSGFFQNHSPFRRKSTKEVAPANQNSWNPSAGHNRPQLAAPTRDRQIIGPERSVSPDPIAANASLALNVGQNVFAVETPDRRRQAAAPDTPEDDPIALALAELKGVTGGGKNPAGRMSADHYHGIATPAPGASPSRSGPAAANNSIVAAAMRGTPPPSYDQQVQVQRLGVPPPAVTSRAMKEASQKFQAQTRSLFSPTDRPGSSYSARPGTRGNSGTDLPRAVSPAPQRSVSPRPSSASRYNPSSSQRSVSPAPYAGSHRGSVTQLSMMSPKRTDTQHHQQQQQQQGYYQQRDVSSRGGGSASPAPYSPRANAPSPAASFGASGGSARASPAPYSPRGSVQDHHYSQQSQHRPGSSMGGGENMAVQLAPVGNNNGGGGQDGGDGYGGSMRGRGHVRSNTALSMRGSNNGSGNGGGGNGGMSLYEGAGPVGSARVRSKSVAAEPGRFTRDGRAILHFGEFLDLVSFCFPMPLLTIVPHTTARALYMYQAAIPEELGFAKGEVLAIVRHQDDGWWEAAAQGGSGAAGLVPSNYLQPC